MEFNTRKVVSLVDMHNEAAEVFRDDIWEEISNSKHGNQEFCNDSYFIYFFPSFNGEENTPIQQVIYELCKGAIEEESILFEVCW